MTVAEFLSAHRATQAFVREQEDFLARMFSYLVNISGKRARGHVTPTDLLGRPTVAQKRDAEEFKKQRTATGGEGEGAK
mgnify:FL=1